jgi:ribonuclease HI
VLLHVKGSSDQEQPQHPRWNYKKAQWGLFRIRTNELTRDLTVEGRNINNVVKEFNAKIIQAAKESIPRGTRKNYTPYWTEELQRTHEMLTKAREEAEQHPCQENNIKLQECKAKHLRTKLQSKRKSWQEKTASLNLEKDTRKLWKITKALNDEDNKEQKITLEEEGRTLTGKAAANAFAASYRREGDTTIPPELQKTIRQEERERREGDAHEAMTSDITIGELVNAIRKLKKKKSPGPDNITNEMLQHLGNLATEKLLEIFNLSWRQGQVPQCWKEARMIPVLKKGKNRTKVLSYRPISLTSCVCKTMEHIVNQRLQLYLETESIIIPEQAGFRQYRSTEDQTTHLTQVIEDAFQTQKVALATFIDLQKAFDKVWKDGLLVKLLRSGIRGHMYQWTKSYLHNRRARVLVNGCCGQKVLLRQGVPQGGVLSPTLFILFINDLVSELPKGVQAALYADDLVLWCTEEHATTATYRMQIALDKVATWADTWCVSINREKTTATLFTLSPKVQPGRLTLGGTPLRIEDQQTYLGVTFDKRMTWKQHVMKAEAKARRKLNIMRKLAGTQWGANEKILKTVYQGSVRPHLEYGSSSWMTAAKTHHQTLDKVQNQALRIITGAMKSTPIEKMEKTAGIPPLNKRRECKAMLQATKYQSMPDHPMCSRLKQLSASRLKRSSYTMEARSLQRKHREELPETIQPPTVTMDNPPWESALRKATIQTTVPGITAKDEQSSVARKALTLAMLEETYPRESWIRVFTDGSSTKAVKNGGAGVFIQFPSGEWKAEARPTGLHCTNYRAEVEALLLAANTISNRVDSNSQVVFLTDALSVLQAVASNKLPELEKALQQGKNLKTVLQWIPSHCGVEGNEQADKMAKQGAEKEQENRPVTLQEMKTIIKSLYKTSQPEDSYHHLSRQEQVTIFRLRTGHNRLNQHLARKLHVVPSPMCTCGEAEQDAAHILQDCRTLRTLREQTWPRPTPLREKLYGPLESLQKTTTFLSKADLQV